MARRKLSSDINVVPYIDVMLVLLIIFMVTAPLLTQGIEVDLPRIDTANIPTPTEPVTISVSAEGQYYINRGDNPTVPVTIDELQTRITALLAAKADEMVLVEGDGKANYEDVARAMAVLQTTGVKKIGFVTKPADQKN